MARNKRPTLPADEGAGKQSDAPVETAEPTEKEQALADNTEFGTTDLTLEEARESLRQYKADTDGAVADNAKILEFLKDRKMIDEGESLADAVARNFEIDKAYLDEGAATIKGLGEEIERTKEENKTLRDALEKQAERHRELETMFNDAFTEKAIDPANGRLLAPGTKLVMADTVVTLEGQVVASFPGGESEQKFVSMCALTDNFEVNKASFRFKYDGHGTLEPLADQVESPDDIPAFVRGLDLEDAAKFGISEELWKSYQPAAETEE